MRRLLQTGLLGLLLLTAGCRSTEPFGLWYGAHQRPEDQRLQAQFVDPYPNLESGPEIVGGRPRDYQRPYAEPRRIQRDRWQGYPN